MPLEAGGFPVYPDETRYDPPKEWLKMNVLAMADTCAAAVRLLNARNGVIAISCPLGEPATHQVLVNEETLAELAIATGGQVEYKPTNSRSLPQLVGEATTTHNGVLYRALLYDWDKGDEDDTTGAPSRDSEIG
jgi:hypothetical protein